MITLSEPAREHFQRLIAQQGIDGLGIRLSAVAGGTPAADCRLEFCEPQELRGDEWEIECEGFSLFVDVASVVFLDGAVIEFERDATGGQMAIRAPALRGKPPSGDASLVERVRYVIENEINPRLASHGGRVGLREVAADGVVVLEFGGGCHGCGMVDVTLRNGVERTLREKVAGVTAVRDATDHDTGRTPYYRRDAAR
jgi:Fe/S biogenesis protein NfuA